MKLNAAPASRKPFNAHHNLSVVVRKQGKISEAIHLHRHAERLAMRNPEQIQLTPEQAERAKQLARRWLIAAGIVLGIIILRKKASLQYQHVDIAMFRR